MSTISDKKRFREYGFQTGVLPTGETNSISDVAGVKVGHVTLIEGNDVRTGVTVIDPGSERLFRNKLPAAVAVGNGFGKMTGTTQIEELGTFETPIALTNTLAVGPVLRGLVDLTLARNPDMEEYETVNGVVGETNDGRVNRIHLDIVKPEHVLQAAEKASKDVEIGCVGAGTGTRAFSWKGGVGTASRTIVIKDKKYVLGALLQTNFGGELTILGVPVGRELGKSDLPLPESKPDGSCMIVLATNAPLSARQLKRIAKRAFLGLARTGSVMAHGSGDYAIAFSTDRTGVEGSGSTGVCLDDNDLTTLFLSAVETVEESVYDALFTATTTNGRDGQVLEELPLDKVLPLLEKRLR